MGDVPYLALTILAYVVYAAMRGSISNYVNLATQPNSARKQQLQSDLQQLGKSGGSSTTAPSTTPGTSPQSYSPSTSPDLLGGSDTQTSDTQGAGQQNSDPAVYSV